MPIEFFSTPNDYRIKQSFVSPTVYLDHWAVRMFADNLELQNWFVTTLLSKGGTILLSHISLAEFAKASDPRHCRDAEAFFERLLPNIYLTDFAFDKVLVQENGESNNSKRFWPSADLPQLKLFGERANGSELGFTMAGFIEMAHINRSEINGLMDDLAQLITNQLLQARNDPAFVEKARNILPSDERPRTLVILGELLRGFHLDPIAPISKNDAIDLLHAAMSVNCCDYVLLDGAWAQRVEQMRQRIDKTSMQMPIAKCFSKRNNGIAAFLADLEAFPDSHDEAVGT